MKATHKTLSKKLKHNVNYNLVSGNHHLCVIIFSKINRPGFYTHLVVAAFRLTIDCITAEGLLLVTFCKNHALCLLPIHSVMHSFILGCEIVASNIFFDDNTCGNIYKYLKVCYECMPDEANAVDVLLEKKRRKKKKKKRGLGINFKLVPSFLKVSKQAFKFLPDYFPII